MNYKLSYQELQENMAYALGLNLSISTKKAVEICNYIRNRSVIKAKTLLEETIQKERPVPMKRFNRDTAHKKRIGPGKYPVKAAKEILNVIKSAEFNALQKGLSTHHLKIVHIKANKAQTPWRYGRQRRRKTKRTHIEVVVGEKKPAKKQKSDKR
ncbi:50S ribosomal protein L22 [Candidatus Woesearchaeota archaeon]|nr:50S ribosomal protein L22 [Candidatus Woesearchaeota archaeon]